MNYLSYAGIGSRKTPPETLEDMTRIARELEYQGFTLRSGGAAGADSAFEAGVDRDIHKEIYLPWPGFNGRYSRFDMVSDEAKRMASEYHPAWDRCSPAARKFHGRNMYQILGHELNQPCDFVLCWTPNGEPVGGTGQALRVAQHYGIPIFNMFQKNWERVLHDYLGWYLTLDRHEVVE